MFKKMVFSLKVCSLPNIDLPMQSAKCVTNVSQVTQNCTRE